MRHFFSLSTIPAGFVLVAAIGLAGCGSQEQASSASEATEIKGAPIVALNQQTNTPQEQAVEPDYTEEMTTAPAEKSPVEGPVQESDLKPEMETAEKPSQNPKKAGETDYAEVGFDHLAGYEFEISDALLEGKGDPEELAKESDSQIPAAVKKLDQTNVALRGYMLPLKVEEGTVTEFLLMRDQSMCCYGTVPKINEWVSVKTVGKGVKPVMDEPIVIYGRLHVGEIRENGYLVGLYRMDGDSMDDSPEESSKM